MEIKKFKKKMNKKMEIKIQNKKLRLKQKKVIFFFKIKFKTKQNI
jgi:hypothetical protein